MKKEKAVKMLSAIFWRTKNTLKINYQKKDKVAFITAFNKEHANTNKIIMALSMPDLATIKYALDHKKKCSLIHDPNMKKKKAGQIFKTLSILTTGSSTSLTMKEQNKKKNSFRVIKLSSGDTIVLSIFCAQVIAHLLITTYIPNEYSKNKKENEE